MTLHKTILATIASLGLIGAAGCLQDIPDDTTTPPVTEDPPVVTNPTPQSNGEEIFQRDIIPLVQSCAGGACHSGTGTDPLKFLGTGDTTQFYSAMVQYSQVHGTWDTSRAAMIEKLQLAADSGVLHFGQEPYTPAEIALIEGWFEVERAARGEQPNTGEPPAGNLDTRQLFAQWAGCMTLDNWNASNMGQWRNKNADGDQCASCHNDGQFWININPDNNTMFRMNKTELYIPGFFAARLNPDGTGEIVPAYDKLVRMGRGDPGSLHPTYNVNVQNDQYFQYLTDFYNRTKAQMEAGTCAAPGFEPL
jgi:hypothetical protein